jgi:hypothetical protein
MGRPGAANGPARVLMIGMSQNAVFQPYLPQTHRCANHPEREGVGICVSCRAVVCVECSTRVDRMNYCIRCLRAVAPLNGAAKPEKRAADRVLAIPLTLAAFAASTAVFAALGYLLALLRHFAPGGVSAG